MYFHIKFWYSFGANITYRTTNGETAISAATRFGHNNVLARLSNATSTIRENYPLQHESESPTMETHPISYKSMIHYESEKIEKLRVNILVNSS